MEQWEITFISLIGAVIAWLALTSIQHSKKLAVMEKVLESIDKKLDGFDTKLNQFLRQEIDVLKELSNK